MKSFREAGLSPWGPVGNEYVQNARVMKILGNLKEAGNALGNKPDLSQVWTRKFLDTEGTGEDIFYETTAADMTLLMS